MKKVLDFLEANVQWVALSLGGAALALAGAVLVAHVGLDRALGYGLKHASGVADTHLGRIGRRG